MFCLVFKPIVLFMDAKNFKCQVKENVAKNLIQLSKPHLSLINLESQCSAVFFHK
jgi:hypothetical protein